MLVVSGVLASVAVLVDVWRVWGLQLKVACRLDSRTGVRKSLGRRLEHISKEAPDAVRIAGHSVSGSDPSTYTPPVGTY